MKAMPIRLAALLWLCAACGAAPAYAQSGDPGANDPSAGSPSGTIYEIPVDEGRGAAAPPNTRG
jgi:hypothetical protein